MTAVLTCRDLAAGYHRQPVVRGFSLEVSPGEIVAVLGSNGAGKTTTLLTLAGLLPPLSGEVRLEDQAVSYKRPYRSARSGLQLVPDAAELVPPRDFHGVAVTYAKVSMVAAKWGARCTGRTLVIADGLHACGPSPIERWAMSAETRLMAKPA